MGMRQVEAEILREAREVTGCKMLRQKDIMEWRTGDDLQPKKGETVTYLPKLGISIAWKAGARGRPAAGPSR